MPTAVDFDYKECLDKNGNFHTGKAKSYLKEIGVRISDKTINYIKEKKVLPTKSDCGFDYSHCVDKNGRFHLAKTKSYLKEKGWPEDLIPYIKIHHNVPPTEEGPKEKKPKAEKKEAPAPKEKREPIDFDYSRCVDGKGVFSEEKTKEYLKELGLKETWLPRLKAQIGEIGEIPPADEETGFDYAKCLGWDGRFKYMKARDHIVDELGYPEAAIRFVIENKRLPKEGEEGFPSEEKEEPVVEEPKKPVKKASPKTPEGKVRFMATCKLGSRRCGLCKHIAKHVIEQKSTGKTDEDGNDIMHNVTIPVKPEKIDDRAFGCKKNPFKVSLISTCSLFKRK